MKAHAAHCRMASVTTINADAVRSFADQTAGVGGTGVRSRRARWRSGSRRSSAGYTETGIPGSREESFKHHHHDVTVLYNKDNRKTEYALMEEDGSTVDLLTDGSTVL